MRLQFSAGKHMNEATSNSIIIVPKLLHNCGSSRLWRIQDLGIGLGPDRLRRVERNDIGIVLRAGFQVALPTRNTPVLQNLILKYGGIAVHQDGDTVALQEEEAAPRRDANLAAHQNADPAAPHGEDKTRIGQHAAEVDSNGNRRVEMKIVASEMIIEDLTGGIEIMSAGAPDLLFAIAESRRLQKNLRKDLKRRRKRRKPHLP